MLRKAFKYQGFTLIEILVAMALMAVLLLGILQTKTITAQHLSQLQLTSLANEIANNQLIAFQEGPVINTDQLTGESQFYGQSFQWTADFAPSLDSQLREIKLRVFYQGQQLAQLRGYWSF
jgi:general secretion pathway protein I